MFSIPLSKKYGLPVIDISGLPTLIDTGAAIPVFSIYPNLLKMAFDAKLVYDNKFVSGFGGRDEGSIFEIKNFSVGKLHFNNIEVFVPNEPKIKYPLLLSATLFYGTKYEIDTINNILTVKTEDTDNLERDFKIKDLKGELYPQINGVLLQTTDLNLIYPSVCNISEILKNSQKFNDIDSREISYAVTEPNHFVNSDFKFAYSIYKKMTIDRKNLNEVVLNFMQEVVKLHGADKQALHDAIYAVTEAENESMEFATKLLNDTLKTKEYRKAFEAQQENAEANKKI